MKVVNLNKSPNPTLGECLENIHTCFLKEKDINLRCKDMILIYALKQEDDEYNYAINYFGQTLIASTALEMVGLLEAVKYAMLENDTGGE